MLSVIKSEKRQVDEFDNDLTLLYTDLGGINNFSKGVRDPREVVIFLQKLFSRFDQLCDENKVYKVHTVGNKYVVMGYNGRIDKSRRNKAVIVDEAIRVIKTGLEMLDIIKETREQHHHASATELNLRIGIHTGKVFAGIIGSKVVRYDIFGEGVLYTNKIEQNGLVDQCCVSEETRNLILRNPDIARGLTFELHKKIHLEQINKSTSIYKVEKSLDSQGNLFDSDASSHEISSDESGSVIEEGEYGIYPPQLHTHIDTDRSIQEQSEDSSMLVSNQK